MKPLFPRNIDNRGRLVRGLGAVGMFIGAAFAFGISFWLRLMLALSNSFVLFKALRG